MMAEDHAFEEWVERFHTALTKALPDLSGIARAEAEGLLAMTPSEMGMAMQQVGLGTHPDIVVIAAKMV